jgi:branched-chain amino acid transport system ATP-binding protein
MLNVSDLKAGYGPIDALHGIHLHVERGEIVALIGANGAGKTSTLMAISGCVDKRGGNVTFDGHDITRMPAHQIVNLGLSQSPEGRKIFPRLSVLENLRMGAYTREKPIEIEDDLQRSFEMFPILKERKDQAGGLLSGGQQQMLAIARALMARPTMLMLDEPSLGLAPQIVAQIFETIKTLNRDRGMSILLVEQNARMALKTAHRGYVIETGQISISGPADKLLTDPRIREAYLGEMKE